MGPSTLCEISAQAVVPRALPLTHLSPNPRHGWGHSRISLCTYEAHGACRRCCYAHGVVAGRVTAGLMPVLMPCACRRSRGRSRDEVLLVASLRRQPVRRRAMGLVRLVGWGGWGRLKALARARLWSVPALRLSWCRLEACSSLLESHESPRPLLP